MPSDEYASFGMDKNDSVARAGSGQGHADEGTDIKKIFIKYKPICIMHPHPFSTGHHR